jgi:hypothetical protein
MSRNDAAFHTPHWDAELLYKDPTTGYMVYRAGEMRIEAKDEQGRPVTIRTTDDLESFGVTTDEQLAARENDPDFYWENNAWFEVMEPDDDSFSGEVFHDYEQAVAAAKRGSR